MYCEIWDPGLSGMPEQVVCNERLEKQPGLPPMDCPLMPHSSALLPVHDLRPP